MATIHHPVTGLTAETPDESLPHYRASGWLLLSEHRENEERARQAEQAEAKAASKSAAKNAPGTDSQEK